MKSDMKMKGVYMTEAQYDICVSAAGSRQFSAWANRTLLMAAQNVPPLPGKIPGGLCGGRPDNAPPCSNTHAWFYNTNSLTYFCEACRNAAVGEMAKLYEDRRMFASRQRTAALEALRYYADLLLQLENAPGVKGAEVALPLELV